MRLSSVQIWSRLPIEGCPDPDNLNTSGQLGHTVRTKGELDYTVLQLANLRQSQEGLCDGLWSSSSYTLRSPCLAFHDIPLWWLRSWGCAIRCTLEALRFDACHQHQTDLRQHVKVFEMQ